MEFFIKLSAYIQNLNSQQFKKNYLIFLLGVGVLLAGLIYYLYVQKEQLITRINQMNKLAAQTQNIILDNRKMIKAEQRLKDILDQNKDFGIKGFFEQFCKENNLNPEQGWDTTTEPVNEKFDEIILPASFKGLSSEQLVKILQDLDKKEIVFIKELTIHNEESGKISCDITMATKRYKYILE